MPWDKYVTNNRITSDQSQQLQRFCGTDASVRAETLKQREVTRVMHCMTSVEQQHC